MNSTQTFPRRAAPAWRPSVRLLLFFLAMLTCCALAARCVRADLLVSEVVTDPQGDHSENTGGNGVPYDDQPGTGTVSSVDEFVELIYVGSDVLDLTGAVLRMEDTTPATHVFGTTRAGSVRFSSGSRLNALQPGARILIGNPTGVLNNAVSLAVFGPDGALWDQVGIDDGNASSADDEALHRVFDADGVTDAFRRGVISPLVVDLPGAPDGDGTSGSGTGSGSSPGDPGSGEPVPEPGTLLLVTAALACRRTLQRARSAWRRRRLAAPPPRQDLPRAA